MSEELQTVGMLCTIIVSAIVGTGILWGFGLIFDWFEKLCTNRNRVIEIKSHLNEVLRLQSEIKKMIYEIRDAIKDQDRSS